MNTREITAEDFETWINPGMGEEKLGAPWLLQKLISASSPEDVYEFDIQTGNRTFFRGVDGYTETFKNM